MKINLHNPRLFPEETHRWGWNGVTDLILEHFHDENADIMLDSMIEHTFKVGKIKGMDFRDFPHMKHKWISIFHSPSTSLGPMTCGWEQNVFTLYADKHYRAFMENCIGMITLSKSFALKTKIALGNMGINIPIGFTHLPHPKSSSSFSMESFRRQVIHIGFMMRNFDSFYRLKTKYKKILLQGPESYVKSLTSESWNISALSFGQHDYHWSKKDLRTRHPHNCNHLKKHHLPNDQYDKIMTESVVFLDLYDSVANNAIVECISRQTPILVNPLDSVVEYLGKDYPFYYYSLDEAAEKLEDDDLIEETSVYLKSRQSLVCPDKFIDDLGNVLRAF